MKILQVVDSLNQGTGGTSYSVSEVSDALSSPHCEVRLVSQNYPALGPVLRPRQADARIVTAKQLPFRLGSITPAFHRELQEGAKWASLIHSNGLWLPTNRMARCAAVHADKPLIISPRGMFEGWSRRHKAFRKRLAWFLFESKNLHAAACLHATSEEEAQTLRSKLHMPIAVIPNGVEIPNPEKFPSREILEDRFPSLRNHRWLLFLSRLHPKKGLMELLNVWKNIEGDFSDWHLLIAGGDEDNYRRKLEELSSQSDLENRVTFLGNLSGEAKMSAFCNSELFVLPSHSENFGRVVAEALSYGVPVITTRQTPWSLLEKENCGWWIEDNAISLEKTLREALPLQKDMLRAMGNRGQAMVSRNFTWSAIAAQFEALYHWILNMDSPPPESIRMV